MRKRVPTDAAGSPVRAVRAGHRSESAAIGARRLPRNDPRQYDELAVEWWRPRGAFAALHWLAATRASLVPPAERKGAILLDLGCGGGLLAPHVRGYRHVGVDLVESALVLAADHGVLPVRADVRALPVADSSVDVVVAGEIFEHVDKVEKVISEIARVLRPGGVLVFDTVSDGWWSRLSLVTIGERLPGGPPPRIHDPALFVAPSRLKRLCEKNGISIAMWGLRPSVVDYIRFLVSRDRLVRLLPTKSVAGLYQGIGRKGTD